MALDPLALCSVLVCVFSPPLQVTPACSWQWLAIMA